jgi:signal recognition particle GTPase
MQVTSADFDIVVREARNKIDYKYYGNFSMEREKIHNSVIAKILMITVTEICNQYNIREKYDQSIPLLVMTVGSVGVGKTTVINWLIAKSYIEMQSFLMISIDTIKY